VREVLGSNRAVGSCVYRKKPHCDLQPWAGLCAPFLQCLGQLQRSTLRGTVNE